MHAPIVIDRLGYRTPDGKPLFTDFDLTIPAGPVGLVGRNGIGKSTLLHLIAGRLTPSAGTIARPDRLNLLAQYPPADATTNVADLFAARQGLARLARIENGRSEPTDLETADWTLATRIETALADVGLGDIAPDRLLADLSGGQQTRAALAALTFNAPDLIVMDEPTNNLDAGGRALVERIVANWPGDLLIVSHDRALLQKVGAMIELTDRGPVLYGGSFDDYADQKQRQDAAIAHDIAHAEKERTRIARTLQRQKERQDRRDAGGRRLRARGGQPKILLDAMKERAEQTHGSGARLADRKRAKAATRHADALARQTRRLPLKMDLPPTGLPAAKTVLDLNAVSGGPDPDNPVIKNISLNMTGPERIALVGPNGAGKTSLLRLIAGDLPLVSGALRRNASLARFEQVFAAANNDLPLVEAYRRQNPADTAHDAHAALARLGFRGKAGTRLFKSLSGGERVRAALALAIGGPAPAQLLLLDEPTNHLDFDALAVLEAGLAAYDGTLIIVSHDQRFLDAVGIERAIALGGD